MKIFLKTLDFKTHSIHVSTDDTILSVKQTIVRDLSMGPIDAIRIIHRGREWHDDDDKRTLSAIGLTDKDAVALVVKKRTRPVWYIRMPEYVQLIASQSKGKQEDYQDVVIRKPYFTMAPIPVPYERDNNNNKKTRQTEEDETKKNKSKDEESGDDDDDGEEEDDDDDDDKMEDNNANQIPSQPQLQRQSNNQQDSKCLYLQQFGFMRSTCMAALKMCNQNSMLALEALLVAHET